MDYYDPTIREEESVCRTCHGFGLDDLSSRPVTAGEIANGAYTAQCPECQESKQPRPRPDLPEVTGTIRVPLEPVLLNAGWPRLVDRGLLTAWPKNFTVGVQQADGAVKRILLSEYGGHSWVPSSPEFECPVCGRAGRHSVENGPTYSVEKGPTYSTEA